MLGKASASDNDVQWQNAGAGDMLSVQYGVTPQQYGGVLGANLADAIDTGKAVILPSDPTTWTAEVADAMMVFQHIDQVRANSPSVINFPAGTFSPSAGNPHGHKRRQSQSCIEGRASHYDDNVGPCERHSRSASAIAGRPSSSVRDHGH